MDDTKNTTEIILDPTDDPGTSDLFRVRLGRPVTVIMRAALGLVGGEFAVFQMSSDNGATEAGWFDAKVDGVTVKMDATNNCYTLPGPGTFRLVKAATTNPTSLIIEY